MHDGCPAGDEKAVTSPLHMLASVHGVATSYVDHAGRTTAVGDASVVAALAATGVDGTDPER